MSLSPMWRRASMLMAFSCSTTARRLRGDSTARCIGPLLGSNAALCFFQKSCSPEKWVNRRALSSPDSRLRGSCVFLLSRRSALGSPSRHTVAHAITASRALASLPGPEAYSSVVPIRRTLIPLGFPILPPGTREPKATPTAVCHCLVAIHLLLLLRRISFAACFAGGFGA